MPTVINVVPPFPFFTEADGSPLEAGYIYIGTSGQNPLISTNQVAVYSDSNLTIPMAQPIRTGGGYPQYVGSPSHIYTAGSDYSILVTDKHGRLIYASLANPPKFGGLNSSSVTYNITTAEATALVVPTDLTIPSHDLDGLFDIRRYGAINGADNTTAIVAANAVATAAGGGTIIFTVGNSLISAPVVISSPNTMLDGLGHSCQYATNYAKDIGHDWSPYNQMFVLDANDVWVERLRCLGNTVGATTNYYAGSFMWWAQGRRGGGATKCYFQNLRYDPTTNSVAIQVRSTAFNVNLYNNQFVDCTGSISHQGSQGSVHHNDTQVTDTAATTPLSVSPGTFDQDIGIDGSTGMSVHNNKCYRSSGAPFSPATIGANSGTINFNIHDNEIYGGRAGVLLYIRASSTGKVHHNIIDGLAYTSLGNWAFLRVDLDSGGVDVTENILRGPMVPGVGTGLGLDISTSSNTCSNNEVRFETNTAATSCLQIVSGTSPAESVFQNNTFTGGGVGTRVGFATNQLAGIEQVVIHRNNTFGTPITTPYSCTGVSRQAKFYIENDKIISTAYAPAAQVPLLKFIRPFRNGFMANFPFSVGANSVFRSNEIPPTSPNYDLTTWDFGDEIIHSQPATGATPGCFCTIPGTFPDPASPYSQAGTAANGSPTITALADTTAVLVGDYISPSLRFATTGPYKIIAKTLTTLTFDTNANANGATTITHKAPIFKNRANLT